VLRSPVRRENARPTTKRLLHCLNQASIARSSSVSGTVVHKRHNYLLYVLRLAAPETIVDRLRVYEKAKSIQDMIISPSGNRTPYDTVSYKLYELEQKVLTVSRGTIFCA